VASCLEHDTLLFSVKTALVLFALALYSRVQGKRQRERRGM
jgi:hypothetical protein